MSKPKNIKEAKELVLRYESISLEGIKESGHFRVGGTLYTTALKLTGFGSTIKCALCVSIDHECGDCIYSDHYGCLNGKNRKTYKRIEEANTPLKLKNAFRARAKYIRNRLKELGEEMTGL